MSNPTPRPASPVDPTQHQLDELEALMQRMLALPVNQLDDEPGSVAALPPLAPLPEWESAPALEMQEVPEIEQPGDREPEEESVVSVAERVLPAVVEQETERPADKQTESPEPVAAAERMIPMLRAPIVVRPPEIERNEPKAATYKFGKPYIPPPRRVGRPTRDRPGFGMRLLLWSNRAFDRQVGRWGGLGRWLRGWYGRALLGLTGLLLLMAALVLGVLEWIGWTW